MGPFGSLIPEAGNERLPMLLMAALAKQSRGYGGGGYGGNRAPANYDGMPVCRRDVKENFHLRGLQRRADMQGLGDLLHQSRMNNVLDSMPAGSQQYAGDAAPSLACRQTCNNPSPGRATPRASWINSATTSRSIHR